ncbi:MAG: EAL domain-containing protein [Candidatus Izemoplasmatales bacterium]
MAKEDNRRIEDNRDRILNPTVSSLKIVGIYAAIGAIWIIASDWAAEAIFGDSAFYDHVQTVKGWFYVAVTAVIFYFIIRRAMGLYAESIGRLEQVNAELDRAAFTDALTGLPNRNSLEYRFREACGGRPAAFILIDIDDFKNVNDMKGHAAGDDLLKGIAAILTDGFGFPASVARLGGDEFAIVVPGIAEVHGPDCDVAGALSRIRRPWILGGSEFFVTYSAGVAFCPRDGGDFATLLRCADTALAAAKERGKNRCVPYDPAMAEKRLDAIRLTGELRHAVERRDFTVHYQPAVDLSDGRMHGAEALIRWRHAERGFIPPMDFIPLAEKTGLIRDIDLYVFEEVLARSIAWNDGMSGAIALSVNLSAKSLVDPAFFDGLRALVGRFRADCTRIYVEITETAFVENFDVAVRRLNEIRAMGFVVSLDDFGIGYSSLTYLSKLPIDALKIDREFVRKASEGDAEGAILKFIVEMAHHLGMKVIVEGIETARQEAIIRAFGGDYAQGYLFARPMPADDALELIRSYGREGGEKS